ncbi:hypothetical protein CTI12_AA054000 [Artemisia annua]|uniref:FCP1 homology domain-containing protein n=1 Tax=Artemisia annua TaxID=35608 RepID=A0A2U1QAY8_ARTAN|nr:hypothetical protein CTI12_AA054000 [Artemisia annua]
MGLFEGWLLLMSNPTLPPEMTTFTGAANQSDSHVITVKRDRGQRTFKRPGVDVFLEHLGQFYAIIVYSDQQQMVCTFLNIPLESHIKGVEPPPCSCHNRTSTIIPFCMMHNLVSHISTGTNSLIVLILSCTSAYK